MNRAQLFPRLAAVPGVAYSRHPGIDRNRLPGAKARPRTQTFSLEGKVHSYLTWVTSKVHSFLTWVTSEGDSTTQSPAAARAHTDEDTTEPTEVLHRVYEALELPGSAADYHFALLAAYESLRSECRTNPDLLAEFECLCLLDVSLVQSRPEAITHEGDGKTFMARVPAFKYLIRLYEREGFLADALAIARSAAACGQGTDDQDRLTKRLQDLKAEDA